MQVKNKIRIDLLKRTLPPEVDAVQGDAYSRYVEISLYSGFAAWAIPQDAVAAVRYRKPDGTRGYYDTMPDGTVAWHIQENTITIQLAPQMLTVKGDVLAQIEIIQGVNVLTTFSLKINVEENPAAGFVRSEDYTNWLQWMEQSVMNRVQEGIDSGIFQGPPGPSGPGAELISSVVTYQAGDSGTIIPSGVWSESIPFVAQGKYLWTREVTQFNTGDPITKYSVTRFGVDGTVKKAAARNLLDNSDFTNPVNQRGNTSYDISTVNKYTIDRWRAYCGANTSGANISIGTDSLTIASNGGDLVMFEQYVAPELAERITGKTATLAVCMNDGTICCAHGTVNPIGRDTSIGTTPLTINGETWYFDIYRDSSVERLELRIYSIASGISAVTVKWVALYEGEYTAETLPEYQPKGYVTELLNCQQYLFRQYLGDAFFAGRVFASDPTMVDMAIPLPVHMVDAAPSCVTDCVGTIWYDSSQQGYFEITGCATYGNIAFLTLQCKSQLQEARECLVRFQSGHLLISAEL